MTVTNINNTLSAEILAHIAYFVDEPGLFSRVCKHWQAVQTVVYDKLKGAYKESASLSLLLPAIAPLQQDAFSNFQIVQIVYQKVIALVKGNHTNIQYMLAATSFVCANKLSPQRLESLINWRENEAYSAVKLFEYVKRDCPEAEAFYATLAKDKAIDQAEKIHEWYKRSANNYGWKCNLSFTTEAVLTQTNLKIIPPIQDLKLFYNLSCLELGSNALKTLPPEIGELKSLENLNVRNNQLKRLPPEIAQLQNLKNLDISYNQLQGLPPEFAQLQNLKNLDISYNQMREFPPELGNLRNLEDFNFYQFHYSNKI